MVGMPRVGLYARHVLSLRASTLDKTGQVNHDLLPAVGLALTVQFPHLSQNVPFSHPGGKSGNMHLQCIPWLGLLSTDMHKPMHGTSIGAGELGEISSRRRRRVEEKKHCTCCSQ